MAALSSEQLLHYCERIHQQAREQLELLPKEKAVHQLRLCTKRLRAAWQLLACSQPILSKQRQRQLNLMAKQLADQRDLDVRRRWLEKLCPKALELLPPCAHKPRHRLNSLERNVLVQQLDSDLNAWRRQPLEDLESGHACTLKKGRKLSLKLCDDSPPDYYHRLRKWAKYLQYQHEIGEQCDPRVPQLTKTLGDKHDLDLLHAWLEELKQLHRKRMQVLEQRLQEEASKKAQRHRSEQLRTLKERQQWVRQALRAVERTQLQLIKKAQQQAQALYQPEP